MAGYSKHVMDWICRPKTMMGITGISFLVAGISYSEWLDHEDEIGRLIYEDSDASGIGCVTSLGVVLGFTWFVWTLGSIVGAIYDRLTRKPKPK